MGRRRGIRARRACAEPTPSGGRRHALQSRRGQQGRQDHARGLAHLACARLRALSWRAAGRPGRAASGGEPEAALQRGVHANDAEGPPGKGHAQLRRQQNGHGKHRRPLRVSEGTRRRRHSARPSRRAEMSFYRHALRPASSASSRTIPRAARRLRAIELVMAAAVLLPRLPSAAEWPGYEKLTREQVVAALAKASASAPVDLYSKNLSGLDLSGIDFKGANLAQAVLAKVDGAADMKNQSMGLMRANILSANLRGADLSGSDFSRADFSFSDLSGANLAGAKLSGAEFSGTDMRGANLAGADLSGSNFIDTDFTGANLADANFTAATFRSVRGFDRANAQGARGLPDRTR